MCVGGGVAILFEKNAILTRCQHSSHPLPVKCCCLLFVTKKCLSLLVPSESGVHDHNHSGWYNDNDQSHGAQEHVLVSSSVSEVGWHGNSMPSTTNLSDFNLLGECWGGVDTWWVVSFSTGESLDGGQRLASNAGCNTERHDFANEVFQL